MIKRLCMLGGYHKSTQNKTRSGLKIISALMLAFTLAGTNPFWGAQAAPASMYFLFNIISKPSADFVCTGQAMTFRVSVIRSAFKQNADISYEVVNIPGIAVDATVADKSIGTITLDMQKTTSGTYEPGVAIFTFTAGKDPGKTTIFFEGQIVSGWFGKQLAKKNYLNDTAQVDVRNCSYKVEMLFQEPMYGSGLITGIAKEIRLNQVSDTHFSGDTYFDLTYNFTPGLGCPIIGQISPVKLEYSADLAGEKLYLNVNFASLKANVTLTSCGDLPTTQSKSVETPPGSATVVVPSKGGLGVLSTPYWTYLFIVTHESQ